MTSHVPRPLRVALSAVMVLEVIGCGVTDQASKPAPTTASATTSQSVAPSVVAPSVIVTPPASPASPVPDPTISPPPDPGPRNPAALEDGVPYGPTIDPSSFVDVIDNPYFPLTPGTSFVFEGGDEHIKIEVTSERRVVMGVSTVVVRDRAFVDGKLAEDTADWFAQDRAGNVWYFGEATTSYDKDPAGDHTGSWEGGVDGALPGIVMLAVPKGGDVYRQEFYAGQAEDLALVRHANGVIKVRAGSFKGLLVTEEWTPLAPDQIELKYYARGVGLVAERGILGGSDLVELVSVTPRGG